MKNDREVMQALLDGETLVDDSKGTDRTAEWRINDNGNIACFGSSAPFPAHTLVKIKQKTININGFEVPEPLRYTPDQTTPIYIVGVHNTYRTYITQSHQQHIINIGFAHLTKEAAELHRKALLSFTRLVK